MYKKIEGINKKLNSLLGSVRGFAKLGKYNVCARRLDLRGC